MPTRAEKRWVSSFDWIRSFKYPLECLDKLFVCQFIICDYRMSLAVCEWLLGWQRNTVGPAWSTSERALWWGRTTHFQRAVSFAQSTRIWAELSWIWASWSSTTSSLIHWSYSGVPNGVMLLLLIRHLLLQPVLHWIFYWSEYLCKADASLSLALGSEIAFEFPCHPTSAMLFALLTHSPLNGFNVIYTTFKTATPLPTIATFF